MTEHNYVFMYSPYDKEFHFRIRCQKSLSMNTYKYLTLPASEETSSIFLLWTLDKVIIGNTFVSSTENRVAELSTKTSKWIGYI